MIAEHFGLGPAPPTYDMRDSSLNPTVISVSHDGEGRRVAGADRGEAPGPRPVRLGRRLRLRRQPPGSWQLWNGGVQRGVSDLPPHSGLGCKGPE